MSSASIPSVTARYDAGMNKAAWVAVFLLLASNAAWSIVWLSKQDDPATSGAADEAVVDRAVLEQTILQLEGEVERLRQSDPILAGRADEGTVAPQDGATPAPDGSASADAKAREAKAAAERALAARKADQAATEVAMEKARAMLKKVMQVQDPGLRQEGLREIADALRGEDAKLIEMTLSVLHSLRTLEKIDRTVFRKLVLEHMDSEHAGVRRSAFYALHATDPESADLRVALKSVDDPAVIVRGHASKLLSMYGNATIEGEAADAVVRLLGDESAHVQRGTLRGLAGTTVAPEVEDKLIEMAAGSPHRREVVSGLGALNRKSRKVVDALFTHLEDEDHRIRSHAHRGLQRGVDKELQPYVAQRYAGHLEKFLNPRSHQEALRVIARYGDAGLAPQLERFAENELVDPKVREMAHKVATHLAQKKPR